MSSSGSSVSFDYDSDDEEYKCILKAIDPIFRDGLPIRITDSEHIITELRYRFVHPIKYDVVLKYNRTDDKGKPEGHLFLMWGDSVYNEQLEGYRCHIRDICVGCSFKEWDINNERVKELKRELYEDYENKPFHMMRGG